MSVSESASLVNVGSVDYLQVLEEDLERRTEGRSLEEEATRLSKSLRAFSRAAWPILMPDVEFVDGWHLGAISEQLEEITAGKLKRLLIWVPPGR